MRKIAEIRKDINAKVAEMKAMDRTDVAAMEKATEELRALTAELSAANEIEAAEQRAAEQKLNEIENRGTERFSFIKFIREASEGKLSGIEAEVAEMGAAEYRRLGLTPAGVVIPSAMLRDATGQNAGTDADGGYLKETMANRYTEVLKEKLVVAQLGATVLTDLNGTLPVITPSMISASWAAEAGAASATKAAFAKATMTPHRNVIQTAFTKDLLKQTSFDVENFLIGLMADAHAELLEAAAIAGSGSNNQPTGILGNSNVPTVAIATNGGAITWAKIVELETKVNANKGGKGRLGYLTNGKVIGEMKTIERTATNGRYLLDGDFKSLNGYNVAWTGLVPSNLLKGTGTNLSAMIFGNFQDLYIGEWGGLDLVIDPYTKAGNGEVVLTVNCWNDALVAEPKSFAKIVDITTA